MADPAYWLWIVGAYLCGSIPFSLLIGLAHGVDIRKHGSGNVGASNCGRVVGARWGLVCFGLDVIKGAAPVLAAGWWFGWTTGQISGGVMGFWLGIAAAPVVGHVAPVWLKFRGGKGVATGFGVILGMWPYLTVPALAALATWLLFASCFRYISLASTAAAVSLPIWLLLSAKVGRWPGSAVWPILAVVGLMCLVVIIRHRGNYRRIFEGTESRLGG